MNIENTMKSSPTVCQLLSKYVTSKTKFTKKGEMVTETESEAMAMIDMYAFDFVDMYVQKMTLPNLTLAGGQTVQTLLGEFPVNGLYLQPDNHTFTFEILNMRAPLHEDVFYAWMREVTSPCWLYDTQPYTTANITVDLTMHSNIKYVFLNCRPSNIITVQPSQEPNQNFTRQIQFTFDWMSVKSGEIHREGYGMKKAKISYGQHQGALEKIGKIGNAANFSASNILKI